MKVKIADLPSWSTASYSGKPDTSKTELSALGEHLNLCRALSGRLFALRCGFEAAKRFMAAHVVTTLVLATLLIGVGLWVF